MDQIEIFELQGYVVEASAVNFEFAVLTTEIRPYIIQQATSKQAVFLSELRVYAIGYGGPLSGVALNATQVYVIDHDQFSGGMAGNNTAKTGPTYRRPGVVVTSHHVYTIEPDPGSAALKSAITRKSDGLHHSATTVYTIEIP